MTEAPELPLHMRRHRFDPIEELAEVREGDGLTRVMTPFGTSAYLVTRYDDVREVLADSTRFSNAATRQVRPPGVSDVSDEELEELRAGQMLAFDPPDHTRLRKMLTSEF